MSRRAVALVLTAILASMLPPGLAAQTNPAPPAAKDAPIALLVDTSSGQVLYTRDADRRFVPASITKTMTLYHAFELIDEGALDPAQLFTMDDDIWREWGGQGSTMWLSAGERVDVDTLLTAIANVSANDGAAVLAKGQAGSVAAWVEGMNKRAHKLGMTQSHFGTPNGWPDGGQTFTSANDLALLAEALITRHPEKYARYIGRETYTFKGIEQRNHDPLIGRVDGADGIKTGYTNEAGYGYLGSAQRDGQRLVLVIGGTDRGTVRARAARNLMEWGFSAFGRKRLFEKNARLGNARVQGGNAREVALVADRTVFVNVPGDAEGQLNASIEYDGPLRAPFSAGDRVANLVIEVPGMEDARIPLYSAANVEKAGFFDRIINGFASWFS